MKKNNILILSIFILLALTFNIEGAMAKIPGAYNGSSSPSKPSGSACPSYSSPSNLCAYNNGNHATIRIALVKYNKKTGARAQIGHSVYYTNSDYNISSVTYFSIGGTVKTESTKGYIDKRNFFANGNNISSDKLSSYYISKDEFLKKNNAINTIKEMDTGDINFKSKESLEKYLKKLYLEGNNIYYRLVVEPVMSFWDGSKVVYYTPKALSKSGKSLTRSGRWCEMGSILYTDYTDIGIKKGSYCGTVDNCTSVDNTKKKLKDKLNGTGYNIVEFYKQTDVKACDYYNTDYFKKNVKGSVSPTSKSGSGPNGENCCNLSNNYKIDGAGGISVLDAYKEQYKKEKGKKPTTAKLKEVFYAMHPECIQGEDEDPVPEVEIADCGFSSEAIYDQGASEQAMLSSVASERGMTNINGSSSQYLRQQITSYGKILCSEKLNLSLPSKYKNKIYRGSKLEWPTYENGLRLNTYPLTLEGTATCYLYIDRAQLISDNTHWKTCQSCSTSCSGEGKNRSCSTSCTSYPCIDYIDWPAIDSTTESIKSSAMDWKNNPASHYDVKGTFSVNYTDKSYGGTFPLARYYDGKKNYKLTGFSFSDTGGSFAINQVSRYKIPQTLYRYVIKNKSQQNISVSSLPGGIGQNYVDVGYGNLPIANNAKKGTYSYSIIYNNLGGFSSHKFATSTTKYTCKYTIGSKPSPECTCDDPKEASYGKDLTTCQTGGCDGKTYTCQEAKRKFCNMTPCECPEGTKACGKDLSDYVASGMSCAAAQARYCDAYPTDKCPAGTDFEGQAILTKKCASNYNCRMLTCNIYTCPPNTTNSGQKLNAIIANHLAKNPGTINNTVLRNIYKLKCNTDDDDDDNGRNNIIYRVIDLDNPFPGKSGTGREPGFNWDDAKIIKNYITNNRGVKTNKVYNKSNAMYHFKLTTGTIRTIRRYNDKNDYSDFKLTCKANGGRNCISSFVHNSSYGLQGDSRCFSTGSFATCK